MKRLVRMSFEHTVIAGAAALGLSLFGQPAFAGAASANVAAVAKLETVQQDLTLVRHHRRSSLGGDRLHGYSYLADPAYHRRGFAGYR
jgi:hypothetical protein